MIDEGYIKFSSDWQLAPAHDFTEINDLVSWRRPLYAAGLIGQFADIGIGFGNISARVDGEGLFIISGTQTGHLAELGRAHFALVTAYDLEANTVTSSGPVEPSSESMTHAALYELDPGFRAVVHVHSDELWLALKDTLPTTSEDVGYGTPQMAREFVRLFSETTFPATGIAVMAGHAGGLISVGHNMQEASERILSLRGEIAS